MKIIFFAPFFTALTSADTSRSRNRLREHQVSSKAAKSSTSPTQTNYPSGMPSTPSPNVSRPLSAKTAKSAGGGCVFDPDDPLSCYDDYVGAGFCADSQGSKRYSETIYDVGNGVSEATCAAKCNECVDGQITGGLFRGFNYFNTECQCLFDFGGTHSKAGICTAVYYEVGGSDGTGPITQIVFPSASIVCYKIKEE